MKPLKALEEQKSRGFECEKGSELEKNCIFYFKRIESLYTDSWCLDKGVSNSNLPIGCSNRYSSHPLLCRRKQRNRTGKMCLLPSIALYLLKIFARRK